LRFDGLTNIMLKWMRCGSEGSCDDFLWDIENVPTAVYICKILIGTVQQR